MKTNNNGNNANNSNETRNAAAMVASFNPEYVSHVKTYADNVRDIYDQQEATARALAKKMAKGLEPDPEHLAQSASVKRIAAAAKKAAAVDTWCKPSAADMLQVRREIAAYIIEELAPYQLEKLREEAREMTGTADTMAAPTADDWKKITLKADDPAAVCALYCTQPDGTPSFTAGWTDRAAAARWFEREKAAHMADRFTKIIESTPTRLVFEPKKGTAGRYVHELRDIITPKTAVYIKEAGRLVPATQSTDGQFCGLYAACGYREDNAGDLFAVLSGPTLAPAFDADGLRLNAGADLAGMSYNARRAEWYKE